MQLLRNSAANGGGIFNEIGSPTDNRIFGQWPEIINANSSFRHRQLLHHHAAAQSDDLHKCVDNDPLFVSQPPIGLGTSGDLRLQNAPQP
ncbi:MAG: hypothetical protein R2788_01915 [Saprospiraceae bacterium]